MSSGQVESVLDADSGTQPSPAAFAKARALRPNICGSDAPERPYPIYLRGLVERGFGRGGKDLGCPTANLPSKVLGAQSHLNRTGIYFGYARVLPQDPDDPDLVDADEELESDPVSMSSSNEQSFTSRHEEKNGNDEEEYYDDPKDEEWDAEDEEVILAASPTSTEGHGNNTSLLLAPNRTRPRQLSRCSVRSNRNVATLIERTKSQTDQSLDFAASPSRSSSGLVTTSTSTDSPLSLGHTSATSPISTIEPPLKETTSSIASNAGSLRRRKKRKVHITEADQRVFPMVMSVGWNPFYKNTMKTAEVHVMHPFEADFYGLEMRVVVLGYIRPEFNYVSKDALIEDIDMDKKVAISSLARTHYQDYATDPFLLSS